MTQSISASESGCPSRFEQMTLHHVDPAPVATGPIRRGVTVLAADRGRGSAVSSRRACEQARRGRRRLEVRHRRARTGAGGNVRTASERAAVAGGDAHRDEAPASRCHERTRRARTRRRVSARRRRSPRCNPMTRRPSSAIAAAPTSASSRARRRGSAAASAAARSAGQSISIVRAGRVLGWHRANATRWLLQPARQV